MTNSTNGLALVCLVPTDNAKQKKSIRQNAATATRNIAETEECFAGGNIGGRKQGTFDIGEELSLFFLSICYQDLHPCEVR